MVGTNCLISGPYGTAGLLLYNSSTKAITQEYTSGYSWQYFQMVGTNCLIASPDFAGVLLYNLSNKTVVQKYNSGRGWNQFLIGSNSNYCLISSTATTAAGVLLYYSGSISSPHNSGYSWTQFEAFGSGYIITSSNTNNPGILYFSGSSVTVITTTEYITTISTSRGYIAATKDMESIIEVDQVNETIKVIFTQTGSSSNSIMKFGNLNIFFGGTQIATYNMKTCELNKLSIKLLTNMTQIETKNGLLLYHSNGSGLLYIDALTEKPVAINTSRVFTTCYEADNLLIFSGSSKGIVAIFNQDNNNYTTINAGYAYNSYARIGSTNAVCINSAEDSIIYNAENNKAATLVKSGTAYTEDSFIEYEGKFYVINTVSNSGVLEYDPSAGTVKKVFAFGENYNQLHGNTLISAVNNSLSFFSYNILTRQRGYYVNGTINDKYIYNTTFIQSLRNAGFQAFTFPYNIQKLITDGTVITNGSIIRKVE